jgi:hypothetical protein
VGGGNNDPLRAPFALIDVALLLRLGTLEPAARVRRERHECRPPPTRINGLQTVWTLPLEAIGHPVLEREAPLAHDTVQHRRRPLRFALQGELCGDIAPRPSGSIRVGPPHLRQEQPLVHERLALPGGIPGQPPHVTLLPLAQRAPRLPCDS